MTSTRPQVPLFPTLVLCAWALPIFTATASHGANTSPSTEEVVVWGEHRSSNQTGYTNPTSVILQEDMASINVTTTEDVVKYEPSLVIRRRFIGDANGTLGIRGSNMFQTSRSMVFADGVPLHYFLQSRWNGAPRWTMVSASEIAQVEVVYGPFSAEYSGNAMGGVILIETAIPQEREVHLDTSYFAQDFSAYKFDGTVEGYKTFASYGDKVGNLNVYVSFNHLENEAQPQTFYYGSAPRGSQTPAAATGSINGVDEIGNRARIYGDSGIVENTTNNFKIKLGYDFGDWQTLLNVAYEDRQSLADSPNPYLRNDVGDSIWSGDISEGGDIFHIPATRFSVSETDRHSLSTGLRLKGELSSRTRLEANINRFAILEDETRTSNRNPLDAEYSLDGSVSDFENTGWQTADLTLSIDDVGMTGLHFKGGWRYETYELNARVFNSPNYTASSRGKKTSHSGGQADVSAFFAQLNWDINQQWDMSIGGRFESWNSRNGYYWNNNSQGALERIAVPGQSHNHFSPKFSVGYKPQDRWIFRYSIAQAYRFPITEELFLRFRDIRGSGTDADASLKPEDGLHQNLSVERAMHNGYIRLNIFQETIKDVIENQTNTTTSVTTFFPIDEVETRGAEWIINAQDIVIQRLDLRFNLAYTDSEIIKNSANPGLIGKTPPRMPKWRSNLLMTYHLTDVWDVGGSLQYASDSYGRADNRDIQDDVYGAQDAYARIGLKTNYRITDRWKLSAGVDNLSDEISFVAHPWPARTFYFTVDWDW
jgi:iron complex outermembrane receptor protein